MSTTEFRDLSPEIVDAIVQHLYSKDDLANLRLVSKDLEVIATRKLFQTVFLSPDRSVMGRYEQLVRSSRLASFAQHVSLWTQRDLSDDYFGDSQWYYDNPDSDDDDGEDAGDDDDSELRPDHEEKYANAVQALQRFQNLKSIAVASTPGCVGVKGRGETWSDVPESFSSRVEKLQMLFEALQVRASAKDSTPVRRLTIVNLQNEPAPSVTSSAAFQSIMNHLHHLHLQIVQEYNEAGPDHDYTRIELRIFPPHLITDWLSPISANLRSLSLYSRSDNWGPFPGNYDALSTLSFPHLETLALGYYTIAHDDQFDWILAIKSLKSLTLHRCMIVRHIRICSMLEWAVDTRDWQVPDIPEEHRDSSSWRPPGEYGEFTYHGVWSSLLKRIAVELPDLQNFTFNYPNGDDYGIAPRPWVVPRVGYHTSRQYYHDDEEEAAAKRHPIRVFPERYVNFDNGILPTHWPEAERDGTVYWRYDVPNHHKEERARDQEALDALMDVCQERRVRAARA